MIINVQIMETYGKQVAPETIEKAARIALVQQNADEDAEITIVFQTNEEIQTLNSQFRGVDSPTDVLAFPADEMDPDTGGHYLGDIAIAYPYARDQALSAGHTLEDELQLLVVHGVLHLLGMDHIEPDDTSQMWKAQYLIMNMLGIDIRAWPLIAGAH